MRILQKSTSSKQQYFEAIFTSHAAMQFQSFQIAKFSLLKILISNPHLFSFLIRPLIKFMIK